MKKYVLMLAVLGFAFSCSKKNTSTESNIMLDEPEVTVTDTVAAPTAVTAPADSASAAQ